MFRSELSHANEVAHGAANGSLTAIVSWSVRLCFAYLLVVFGAYGLLLIFAGIESAIRNRQRSAEDFEGLETSRFTIPVSIISCLFNEEPVAVASTRTLLAQDYPEIEVIVIDDGSTDGTFEQLEAAFELEQREVFFRRIFETRALAGVYRSRSDARLTVVRKLNGGKADALNCGLNFARYRYVLGADGDTMYRPEALLLGMRLVMHDPARVIGVTSTIAISTRPELVHEQQQGSRTVDRSLLSNFQHLDYLRAFLNNRLAWSRLRFMLCTVGAFHLWRRDVLEEVGGFSRDFTCEDIEMTFRVHEKFLREGRPYEILCVPETVATTEGPAQIRGLVKQRARWQRVIMETLVSPAAAAYVSGSVNVSATATDGAVPPASGVSAVRFEIKPTGAGSFAVFGTQTVPVVGSTYQQSLVTGSYADGPADLQVVVTDAAGNVTTSATRTINIDNVAPTVTLDDPGAAVGASANLSASSSGDTANVAFRYRPVGSGGAGTLIGSDATAPFAVTWTTAPAAEQQWELIAVATDGGGNVSTSAPRVVLVDRTLPTGSVTSPPSGATVGGPAVTLAASAADVAGSSVAQVEWQVKLFGSGTFNAVATDTTAPYDGTWNATGAPDGAADIRALITDAAGNVRTTAVITVTVDSTGPSVTLADPGAVVTGTVALSVTTGGGAVRVTFGVSPAGGGTWTEIASDTSAPFGTPFDTRTVADGLYDLRAIGYDALGNSSAPLGARQRALRQHRPGPGVLGSRGRIRVGFRQPDRADRERARDRTGSLARRSRGARAGGLRLDADLRHRRLERRPACPLGRARGRQRHAHAVPRRGHDLQHAVGRSAAGGAQHHVVRRLDADHPGRPRDGEDAAGRVADPADAAGLHPGAPGRRRAAAGRLRSGDAGGQHHRALGDRGHVRDRVPRADRDHLLEPERPPRDPGVVADRDVAVEHDPAARGLDAAGRKPRRLLPRCVDRARADAPPHLLRPDAGRRGADGAARRRRCRRRRRPHDPLDPRLGREWSARKRRPLRQRRGLPSVQLD